MPPTTVAEARAILDTKGFAVVNDLTEEGQSELFGEGYQIFHFDTETQEGEMLKFIVATSSDKTYREAENWFIDTIIDPKAEVEEVENLDPSKFETLDINDYHVPIRPFYLIKRGMSSWAETSVVVDSLVTRVLEVTQDELDRTGFVFLNDIFPFLDLPKTRLGQLYGWKDDETITVETEMVVVESEYGKGPGYKLVFPTAHYILDQVGD